VELTTKEKKMPAKRDPAERFFEKIERIPEAGCWIWTASLDAYRYGALGVDNRPVKAHRFSWELHFGSPGEWHVLHRCDVPCCVNPHHLFLGSHLVNMEDMKAKRRAKGFPGELNVKAKFTAEQVAQIRLKLQSGQSCNSIANELGVVHSTISRIKRGVGWS
jgi:hypothetical protein